MRILAFAGKKQSGKSSAQNFVLGSVLTGLGIVDRFDLSTNGDLLIPYSDENGHIKMGKYSYTAQCEVNEKIIWPTIRVYNFADKLKQFTIECLGLSWESVYGTDEQKNQPTHLVWENMPVKRADLHSKLSVDHWAAVGRTGLMSGREVLQYFGTDVCRSICSNIWVDACLRQIYTDQPAWAIIGDCRYPNEVEGIVDAGGQVIKFLRNSNSDDIHTSETALDPWNFDQSQFNLVVDNQNITLTEKNQILFDYLCKLGWLSGTLQSEDAI